MSQETVIAVIVTAVIALLLGGGVGATGAFLAAHSAARQIFGHLPWCAIVDQKFRDDAAWATAVEILELEGLWKALAPDQRKAMFDHVHASLTTAFTRYETQAQREMVKARIPKD